KRVQAAAGRRRPLPGPAGGRSGPGASRRRCPHDHVLLLSGPHRDLLHAAHRLRTSADRVLLLPEHDVVLCAVGVLLLHGPVRGLDDLLRPTRPAALHGDVLPTGLPRALNTRADSGAHTPEARAKDGLVPSLAPRACVAGSCGSVGSAV